MYRVLVIDDDEDIGLVWSGLKKKLEISELMYAPNLEALQIRNPDIPTFDLVFVDKNIEGSAHDGAATIAWLRTHGARRVILATGERASDLQSDPQFANIDAICAEKIPTSLTAYLL